MMRRCWVVNKYEIDLDKSPANYQPLTPLTYLERASRVFAEEQISFSKIEPI